MAFRIRNQLRSIAEYVIYYDIGVFLQIHIYKMEYVGTCSLQKFHFVFNKIFEFFHRKRIKVGLNSSYLSHNSRPRQKEKGYNVLSLNVFIFISIRE